MLQVIRQLSSASLRILLPPFSTLTISAIST